MRHLLLTTAILAGLWASAQAQQAGTCGVEGQGADGSRYQGTAALAPLGPNTWHVGGDTAEGVGILIPEGPLLVVGDTVPFRPTGGGVPRKWRRGPEPPSRQQARGPRRDQPWRAFRRGFFLLIT